MTPPDTFKTDRLVARRPRREDAPAVYAAYANDPKVTKYLCWKTYTEVNPLSDFLEVQAGQWLKKMGTTLT